MLGIISEGDRKSVRVSHQEEANTFMMNYNNYYNIIHVLILQVQVNVWNPKKVRMFRFQPKKLLLWWCSW